MYISGGESISSDLKFPHPMNIVLGMGSKIGKNVEIYQGVTVGAGNPRCGRIEEFTYPTIEDDVTIYANAVIIGEITLGQGCVVAAGAVVTKDVPPYTLVGGVPAKVLKILEKYK
ncbi:MAG: hypothetical protein LBS33_05115 [Streptococcaceae bacterium]|nr:hypothetical protein [Streptococcaceae bacterium]